MKKNRLLLILILAQSTMLLCQTNQQDQTTPVQALQEKKLRFGDVTTVADPLFNPVTTDKPPKPNPYPTQSINEQAIQTLFGQGLKVSPKLLQHLKNCYFYIEYLAKLEIGARIAAYAKAHNIDAISILGGTTGWKGLIDKAKGKAGGWSALLTALKQIEKPAYDIIQGTIDAPTWQDVTKSSFWQNIPVTAAQIIASSFWQKYLKYTIAKSYEQDKSLLGSIFDVEKRIFMYIPNIEVAYYNADFEYLRNSSEFFRLNLVLTDAVRDRYIRQTTDWQKFIDNKTKQIDLVKTYSAAVEFKQSNFYSLAALADQPLAEVVQQVQNKSLKITNSLYAQEPMAQTELTCLAMIKNIQAQLHYLFDKDHLDATIKVLADKATAKPNPSLLFYESTDYLYLEDLVTVLKRFERAAPEESDPNSQKIVIGGKGNEKIEVQGFGSWLSDKWDSLKDNTVQTWNDVEKSADTTWQDAQKLGKDIGGSGIVQAIANEAKAIGMSREALLALIDGNPKQAEDLLKKAVKLQGKIVTELKQTFSDVQTIFNDTKTLAKDGISLGAKLATMQITIMTGDPALGKALEGAIESGAGMIVDFMAEMTAPLFAVAGAVIYLSIDAIETVVKIGTKVVMDLLKGKGLDQLGKDLWDGIESQLADIATTLWSSITFVGQQVLDQLMDAVKLVGYITAALAEMVIYAQTTILELFAAIADSVGWKSAEQALNSASQEIQAHRRLITATITTVILVGVVIATGGLALPMIAMTVGPQAFQIGGAIQQDQRAEDLKLEQKKFLGNYSKFVDNNKIIYQHSQDAITIELDRKFEAQITNEERELGFYQNFVNNYFASTKEQMSFYLGTNLAPQLEVIEYTNQKDEKYQVRYADVGTLYGFKTGNGDTTGVLNLNPSQGFPLYNKTRDTFSQEIAVYPALSMQLEGDKQLTSTITRKFWFNQKETMPLTSDVSEVEVRWQAIYILNSFHIGLYFGGQPVDVKKIRDTKKADIDAGHLAKVMVYKKDDKNKPVTLNLYEHEGQGWFAQTINAPAFQAGTWYRMKMQLNGTNLQVKTWKEGDPEPSWQSFTVAKTLQKTIGMVSSGASIQYQIVNPKIDITQVTELRGTIKWQTEKQREIDSREIMQQKLTPTIGNFKNLQAVGKPQILKGQFMYTTKETKLTDAQNKAIDDYVILGRKETIDTVDKQGASPREEIGYDKISLQNNKRATVVSLISGNAFGRDGSKFTTCANVLNTYTTVHGPLTDELNQKLDGLHKQYLNTMMGPFTFGTVQLNATSTQELERGQFIYKAVSPEKELRDKEGKPIKDDKGNSIYDYFLMADENAINVGFPYDKTIPKVESLVTAYIYDRTGAKEPSGYSTGSEALDEIGEQFSTRRPALDTAIDLAIQTYTTILQKETEKGKPLNIKPVQQTNPNNSSTPDGPHSSTTTGTSPVMDIKPADESMQGRGQQASGGETSWGG